jgi:hypothetical protein
MQAAARPGAPSVLTAVGAIPAGAGNAMTASLDGIITGVNLDPDDVAARCPPGYPQAIAQSAFSGVPTSEAYTARSPLRASTAACCSSLPSTISP